MDPTTIETNMRTTTLALLHAFDGQWQPTATLDLRAPECIHTIYPSSLGVPARTKDEWAAYFSRVCPNVYDATVGRLPRNVVPSGELTCLWMTLDDYVSDPVKRRVVARSTLRAMTRVGEYMNEYCWFLTFDGPGERIVRIEEFLDGRAAGELLAGLREKGLV